MLQCSPIMDSKFQGDFFKEETGRVKPKKMGFLAKYSERRALRQIRIPIEYTVLYAIGILVLIILAYAVGVERGKKFSSAKDIAHSMEERKRETDDVISEVRAIKRRAEEEAAKKEAEEVVSQDVQVDPEKKIYMEKTGAAIKETVAVPALDGPEYIVQLASFKNEEHAKEAVSKLDDEGVRAGYTRKGDWYQVYVGGYGTNAEAQRIKIKLSEQYGDSFIRKIK